jgi:signal transduction histidine kinase
VHALAGSLNAMLARVQQSVAATHEALEASRRFAADVGHELRTPLTSMQTNLSLVARTPALPPDERVHVLEELRRDQERLRAVVDALEALARAEAAALTFEPTDVADVCDQVILEMRALHPAACVRLHAPDEGTVMWGSPEGLRLIVRNLVENGIRHGGGTVDVRLEPGVRLLTLVVDDQGRGVAPAERERVFERFYRSRRTGATGSGLGLALVAQLTRLHGGRARVLDSPAGGARFRVDLPARAVQANLGLGWVRTNAWKTPS